MLPCANKSLVILPEAERAGLQTLIGCGVAPAHPLAHARILLKADQGAAGPGWADAMIAGAVEVHPTTVARVAQGRCDQRPGGGPVPQPSARADCHTLGGAQEARLIALTRGPPPEGHAW